MNGLNAEAIIIVALFICFLVTIAICFYYRQTYGGLRKCRFCLAVGINSNVPVNGVCSFCGRRHIRKDLLTEEDESAIAAYKIDFYARAKKEDDARDQRRELRLQERQRRVEEKRQIAERSALDNQQEADRLAHAAAAEATMAIERANEERERADVARLKEQQAKEQADQFSAGDVVAVVSNNCKALNPLSDVVLTRGELIQVDFVDYNDKIDAWCVYYKRMGKQRPHGYLPVPNVQMVLDLSGSISPGSFVKATTSNVGDCKSPYEQNVKLRKSDVLHVLEVKEIDGVLHVGYFVGHDTHYIPCNRVRMLLDPFEYIGPDDVVRVNCNEVNAHNPDNYSKLLRIGETVKVGSVSSGGTKGFPNKPFDAIVYDCPNASQSSNYLPMGDITLIKKSYEVESHKDSGVVA